jgi:hypothetical protein
MAEVYKFITVPPSLDKEKHDFFVYNPEIRYYPQVEKLVKDVGPLVASNIMWAIYLSEDPSSKFYTNRIEVRRKYVEEVFLKIEGFDWESYSYLITAYPDMAMSLAKRDFHRLRKKYDTLLNEVEGYDLEKSLPFFKSLKIIYEGLEKAEDRMNKENATAKSGGGKNTPGRGINT